MVRILLLNICVFVTAIQSAAANTILLQEANNLIASQKYFSAFNMLCGIDKNNQDPDVQLKKTELALNYYAKNLMHRSFAFVDLTDGQTLEEWRTKDREYSLIEFRINEILDKLIQNNKNDGRLYKALGDYYFEVQSRYGNKWFEEEKVLFKLIDKNYTKSLELGTAGYIELDRLGIIMIFRNENSKALEYFKQSIKTNASYGMSYYNCAYVYYIEKKYDDALQYAKQALELLNEAASKFDTLFLIGSLYVLKNDSQNALQYYNQALSIKTDYETLKAVLVLYLKLKNTPSAEECAVRLFQLDITNLAISQDILFIYGEMNFKNDFLKFMESMEKKYTDNNQVLGNICFNRAFFYNYYFNDLREKKTNLLKARDHYLRVFSKDHMVFPIIEKELQD